MVIVDWFEGELLSRYLGLMMGLLLVLFVLIIGSVSYVSSASASIQHTAASVQGNDTIIWDKWFKAYRIVSELSRTNMNVSKYIPLLQESYVYLKRGDIEKAERVLDSIMPDLDRLYNEKDSFVFWSNFRKAVVVVVIASIPILFYVFFPRLYLWIWFKAREKWVVEK